MSWGWVTPPSSSPPVIHPQGPIIPSHSIVGISDFQSFYSLGLSDSPVVPPYKWVIPSCVKLPRYSPGSKWTPGSSDSLAMYLLLNQCTLQVCLLDESKHMISNLEYNRKYSCLCVVCEVWSPFCYTKCYDTPTQSMTRTNRCFSLLDTICTYVKSRKLQMLGMNK